MPRVQSIDGAVAWPAGEGTLGVVGVAPWATLDFLKALYGQVAASKDWHYPRVLCDLNTKLPSRGRHLELGERDPSPFIAETITELAAQGASAVVVPCNTAHILYPRWAARSPVPVPSIVDATTHALHEGRARKAAILASTTLYRHGLYQRALGEAGIAPCPLLDEEVVLVADTITAVKTRGGIDQALQPPLERMFARLAHEGVDGVVLGCTELAGLAPLANRHVAVVAESNAALACAALRAIGMTPTVSAA